MDVNLVTNLQSCLPATLRMLNDNLSILYYSHIPTAIIPIIVTLFVFLRNRKNLSAKILLSISVVFALWSFFDLVTWLSSDSRQVMFAWAVTSLLDPLFFILNIWFVYAFLNKSDIDFFKKMILGIIFLPAIFIVPTTMNLKGFDAINCVATESYFTYYIYFLETLSIIWVFFLGIGAYRKAEIYSKKSVILLISGVELFLILFFSTGYLSGFFESYFIQSYQIEIYGLFGMPVFMGFLAYLIVKYKAFDVKLLGAQALVVSLVILIGSQFFFIQNRTNQILTGITLSLAIIFGYILIKSVKAEAERKEELQHMADALAVSNDRLKKLDNAKTEFISIASHQLRTPLTVIKGYISLIADGSYGTIPAELATVIGNIKISNDRLIALVEDLLNISRIESGRMEFDMKPVDITELCTEIFNSFTFKAKDGNIDLQIELPGDDISDAVTDRNKLREVISNLTDNAIKYTPAGWVKIKAFQKDSETVRIEISDSGIGIPATEMPYLFAKFSRGKDTGRLNASGTGLGLHVGKKMIEALHGRIWAESEGDKKGSTFIIELPIKTEQQ